MFNTKRKVVAGFFLARVLSLPLSAYAEQPIAAAVEASKPVIEHVEAATPEDWAVHGQFTLVTQSHPALRSPYMSTNSLDPMARNNETVDLTLILGRRLWKGAEFWINPEIDQGFGLSNTLGVAGFPNGEAYKIGANAPYLRIPRAFIRQVIPLAGEVQNLEAMANQLGGQRAVNNVTITAGKFSVADIFDANTYAHDPRSDFLNWSILDSGAFDYAADSWGFTYGAAVEWNQDWWTLRGGLFQLSKVPNGKIVAPSYYQHSYIVEAEERHHLLGRPGKLKLLAYVNQGDMASYRDASALGQQTGTTPDVALVRRYASRPGIALNFEQEVAKDLGVFVRAGVNDGSKEAYEFTDINRSLAAGLSLHGTRWHRPDDVFGIAGVINAISPAAKEYFSLGGLGVLVGDGALTYGTERILETFYSMQINPTVAVALNYQHVTNPGYNRDRGPVSIYGLRVHAAF